MKPRRAPGQAGFPSSTRDVWIVRVAVFVLVMGLWQWYGSRISAALFAPPTAVASALYEQTFVDPVLPKAFLEMNVPLLIGFVAAALCGTALGLAMGRWRAVRTILNPYLSFLYALPQISLIPVLILWLGLGLALPVVLVFVAALLPIAITTVIGTAEVDHQLRDVARASCASPVQEMRTVMLPGTLPFILSGLQTGLAQALIAVIVVEMTAALRGLGGLIQQFGNFFQTADMIAPIFVIGLESVLLMVLMKYLRRRAAPWSVLSDRH